jgi:hypothetical protein
MILIGVDPGTTESGWVRYEPGEMKIMDCGIQSNVGLLDEITYEQDTYLIVERIACMGMAVGKETFDTVEFIGALLYGYYGIPDWAERYKYTVTRHQCKIHHCGTARARDANIQQAIIDRFPPTGGGKVRQIGTKKNPGPLYGVSSHCWNALAVCLTWYDTTLFKNRAGLI